MKQTEKSQNYYFVPLGYEQGGYLDLLKVAPDTSEVDIGKAESSYRERIQAETKAKKSCMKARLDYQAAYHKFSRGEITQTKFDEDMAKSRDLFTQKKRLQARLRNKELSEEEYERLLKEGEEGFDRMRADAEANQLTREEADAQEKIWEVEENEKLENLNKLKGEYEAKKSRQRDLKRRGLADDTATWVDLYSTYKDPELFWHLVFSSRPLREGINQSMQLQPGRVQNLTHLLTLVDEARLELLLWADLLWEKTRGVNRGLWQAQVADWLKESVAIEMTFDMGAQKPGLITPSFPSLSQPTPLAVSQLENIPEDQVQTAPVRADQPQVISLADLLAAMLQKAQVPGAGGGANSPKPENAGLDPDADVASFFELIRMMMGSADKNK